MINTINVPFHGDSLYLINYNNEPYVPMKPVVDGMGMDWAAQFTKLKQRFNSTIAEIAIVAGDNKSRNMVCLPLRKLAGWLQSISPNKVKPEIRDKVIQYQNECDDVLYEYWTTGEVKNKGRTTVDERTPLRDAVNMLVGKKGICYSEAYSYIHQRFNVSSLEELSADQLPAAIEYIHKLAVEKEPALFTHVNVLLSSPGRWLVTLLPGHDPQIINAGAYNLIDADTCDKLSKDIAYFSKELMKLNKLSQLGLGMSERLRVVQGEANRNILEKPLKLLA